VGIRQLQWHQELEVEKVAIIVALQLLRDQLSEQIPKSLLHIRQQLTTRITSLMYQYQDMSIKKDLTADLEQNQELVCKMQETVEVKSMAMNQGKILKQSTTGFSKNENDELGS
jgi:hypothetical protein